MYYFKKLQIKFQNYKKRKYLWTKCLYILWYIETLVEEIKLKYETQNSLYLIVAWYRNELGKNNWSQKAQFKSIENLFDNFCTGTSWMDSPASFSPNSSGKFCSEEFRFEEFDFVNLSRWGKERKVDILLLWDAAC